MTKQRWLFVVLGGVLIMLAYGLFALVHTPSDEDMIARFQAHRPAFDQLLQMFVDDKQDVFITTIGRSWVDVSTSIGVSASRERAYHSLMRRAGIVGMGVTSWRRRTPPHDLVQFIDAPYRGFIGPEKSWVYTTEPLTWPLRIRLTDGDTADYRFPPPMLGWMYRIVCRPIEANWYICVDYTD